jgi:hypothetical protein
LLLPEHFGKWCFLFISRSVWGVAGNHSPVLLALQLHELLQVLKLFSSVQFSPNFWIHFRVLSGLFAIRFPRLRFILFIWLFECFCTVSKVVANRDLIHHICLGSSTFSFCKRLLLGPTFLRFLPMECCNKWRHIAHCFLEIKCLLELRILFARLI